MKRILILPLLLLYTNCIPSQFFDSIGLDSKSKISQLALIGLAGASANGEPVGGGEVTASGATLRSTDGMLTIDIPADAVGEPVEFTITKITPESNFFPGSYLPTSSAYELLPSYRFKKPVNVSLSLNITDIQGLNLVKNKSLGFSFSSTSSIDNTGRFPSWTAHDTKIVGDKVVFSTETFSIFGTATPPSGNQPPVNSGAYYYFKPGCSYLPYLVRTQVIDPDGDAVTVYLITGPAHGGAAAIQMTREGSTNWFSANIPYEAMVQAGIQMQISATDSFGQTSFVPSNSIFKFPASSNDPVLINGYDRDRDNDGILCAWERDNGRSDTNASDVGGLTDSDGDGIPNIADHTPNGETNPVIDNLEIFPSIVSMNISEKVIFGAKASLGGQYRYVNANFTATGIALNGSSVGNMIFIDPTSAPVIFQPSNPGIAGVVATVGSLNATATVTVKDSVGPSNITDLTAISLSQNKIRLQWTAPGDDGIFGRASTYQIYRSTSLISNNSNCSGVLVNHGLSPKNAGVLEQFDVPGLSPNTTYYFCIRAFDDSGNLNTWNGSVSATTQSVPDLIPPADISNVTAVTLGIDKIQLNWNSVGDDGNIGLPAAYEIFKSTLPITNDNECRSSTEVLNNVAPASPGSPTTFTVANLSDNTVYYFCVVAVDESGNYSKWNSLTTATTPRANRSPVISLVNVVTTDDRAAVVFSAEGSSDPDAIACGAVASNYVYSWTLLNKPPTSSRTSGDILNSSSLIASFAPDVAGNYVLQFTFTDHKGVCGGNDILAARTVTLVANYIGYNDVSYEFSTPAGYIYSVPVEGVDYVQTNSFPGGTREQICGVGVLYCGIIIGDFYAPLPESPNPNFQLFVPEVTDYWGSVNPSAWTNNGVYIPVAVSADYFYTIPWPNGQPYKRVWDPTVTWTASGNVGFKTNAEWAALQADVAAGTKRNLVGTRF